MQEFFKGAIRAIRPLYLVEEQLVSRYARDMGWEGVDLGCPSDGSTKRAEIREMLSRLYRSNRKVKGNIFHALQNVKPDYLP
jgi:tRNA 2-thiocytidine biosynthesis protein TtcA